MGVQAVCAHNLFEQAALFFCPFHRTCLVHLLALGQRSFIATNPLLFAISL